MATRGQNGAQPGADRREVLARHSQLYREGLDCLHAWNTDQLVAGREGTLALWARAPVPGMILVDDVTADGRRYAMLVLAPDYVGPEPPRAELEPFSCVSWLRWSRYAFQSLRTAFSSDDEP